MCKDDKQVARRLACAVADTYFYEGLAGRVRVPCGLLSMVRRFAHVFGVPEYFINITIKGV